MKHILTLTSNDQGLNYGPSIHFLELWNAAVQEYPELNIEGHAPSWSGKEPIVKPNFHFKRWRVIGRGVRQIIWDFYASTIIIKSRADVIYIRLSSFHLFSCAVLKFIKTPIVVEINGTAQGDGKSRNDGIIRSWIACWGERYLIQRAIATFSVTPQIQQFAKSLNYSATHIVVQNGVAKRFFCRLPNVIEVRSKKVCIYVGTFTAWDGSEKISKVAEAYPNVHFIMVGDGDRRASLESSSPKNMEYLGYKPYMELPNIYAMADFSIVLYETERHNSMGNSSLKIREYLASGLPVFTTNVKGSEFVETCGFGYLTENDLLTDFSKFLKNIDQYRSNIQAQSKVLEDDISWVGAARNTISTLKLLLGNRVARGTKR